MRKLLLCASVVTLAVVAIPASKAVAASASSTIATHECSTWNYSSKSYEGQQAYGQRYMVENDVWNPVKIKQTLYSCNFNSFFVEANVHNEANAVQSYPSSQYTFAEPTEISKFKLLTSDFRISDPPVGSGLDYEYAYDIWINGYGGKGHTEMMIWTYNDGQRPSGDKLSGTISVDGHTFYVWKGGTLGSTGDMVTFEATKNYRSGNTNLLPFLSYASSHGWLESASSTPVWQIDYGAELCQTAGMTKFDFTDFRVRYTT